jgi:hypothetical protein
MPSHFIFTRNSRKTFTLQHFGNSRGLIEKSN